MKNELKFALEIDYHRGGRCYVMQGGITTTNPRTAFKRADRGVIDRLAKQFEGKNPKVVTV